ANGLRHRAVHIWVFNPSQELFVQKRSLAKDVAPGKWDSSCCGHVDSGEDYEIAALRELSEELGIRVRPEQLIFRFKIDACEETGQEFVKVYELRHGGPFVLQPEEISDGRWIDLPGLERWTENEPDAFAVSFRHIWSAWRREEPFT
ncbi:MAG: NUDIX domain-containing protein, partial [Verrucomicrobiae bacterium]|nr:NUDIX domain-containing protein [Verrucomicrobiae bacterium]